MSGLSNYFVSIDDAHDAVDFDAVNDPRLQCLYQQLRQREEVLKQLEEEEKAFLDEERSIMGPKGVVSVLRAYSCYTCALSQTGITLCDTILR